MTKDSTKAWICGAMTAMLWGNSVALVLTGLGHGTEWSELKLYLVALCAAGTAVMGVASGVASFLYSDQGW